MIIVGVLCISALRVGFIGLVPHRAAPVDQRVPGQSGIEWIRGRGGGIR